MTTTKAATTPGALRAARALIELNETTIFSPGTTVRIAEIIDRETAAPEMMEALELVAKTPYAINNWIDFVQAAIQKTKGGQ